MRLGSGDGEIIATNRVKICPGVQSFAKCASYFAARRFRSEGVRGLRVTGNAIEWTTILTGGAPTHQEQCALSQH